jgi:hypothetical protein
MKPSDRLMAAKMARDSIQAAGEAWRELAGYVAAHPPADSELLKRLNAFGEALVAAVPGFLVLVEGSLSSD